MNKKSRNTGFNNVHAPTNLCQVGVKSRVKARNAKMFIYQCQWSWQSTTLAVPNYKRAGDGKGEGRGKRKD